MSLIKVRLHKKLRVVMSGFAQKEDIDYFHNALVQSTLTEFIIKLNQYEFNNRSNWSYNVHDCLWTISIVAPRISSLHIAQINSLVCPMNLRTIFNQYLHERITGHTFINPPICIDKYIGRKITTVLCARFYRCDTNNVPIRIIVQLTNKLPAMHAIDADNLTWVPLSHLISRRPQYKNCLAFIMCAMSLSKLTMPLDMLHNANTKLSLKHAPIVLPSCNGKSMVAASPKCTPPVNINTLHITECLGKDNMTELIIKTTQSDLFWTLLNSTFAQTDVLHTYGVIVGTHHRQNKELCRFNIQFSK